MYIIIKWVNNLKICEFWPNVTFYEFDAEFPLCWISFSSNWVSNAILNGIDPTQQGYKYVVWSSCERLKFGHSSCIFIWLTLIKLKNKKQKDLEMVLRLVQVFPIKGYRLQSKKNRLKINFRQLGQNKHVINPSNKSYMGLY